MSASKTPPTTPPAKFSMPPFNPESLALVKVIKAIGAPVTERVEDGGACLVVVTKEVFNASKGGEETTSSETRRVVGVEPGLELRREVGVKLKGLVEVKLRGAVGVGTSVDRETPFGGEAVRVREGVKVRVG